MSDRMRKVFVLSLLVVLSSAYSKYEKFSQTPLRTEYEWRQFDYDWKTIEQKNYYIYKKFYDPAAMTPIDVDRSPDGRTFITIIKAAGVPATLNTVSTSQGPLGHLLEPYPDWSWYDPNNVCKGIVNVYRIAIDSCNRLWVLDTGSINNKQICPAKLLAFDLYTNKCIFQNKFDDKLVRHSNGTGLLITPIVETSGPNCEDTTVYIADVLGHALLVWNKVKTVRLENEVFSPDYRYANHRIAGESFYLDDGVLGMALSPKLPDGTQFLVFRPLASTSMYAALTRELHGALKGSPVTYIKAPDVLQSPAAAQAFSSEGTLFYGLTEQIALGCWNMRHPMVKENFKTALVDQERLQFVSGMKVIKSQYTRNKETLLMLSNRIQKIYSGTLSPGEVNFRIMSAHVDELVKGKNCDVKF